MGLPEPEIHLSGFTESVVKGLVPSDLPKAKEVWRVSSLVNLYKVGCEKLLYNYLMTGQERKFDDDLQQTFAIGHKVHDLVKEWFDASPDFNVLAFEKGVRHSELPITGTMDIVCEWNKYPDTELVIDIKSCATEYVNNPVYGSRKGPFKAARWQVGLYNRMYRPESGKEQRGIVLYYDKNNGELIPHLLPKEDQDVDKILAMCRRVVQEKERMGDNRKEVLAVLNGPCKRKPGVDKCHLVHLCDLFEGK